MPFVERPLHAVGYSRTQYGERPAAPHAVDQVFAMQLPNDPEAASMMSLDYIHQLVRDGRADPAVRHQAFRILRDAGVRERDYRNIIAAIHRWVQANVYYMHDPSGVELLTQARVLLQQVAQGDAVEDCDSFVLLEQSLLQSVGVPTQSVIWKADRRDPSQWSHITLEAHDGKRWIPLDPIMKDKPIGWEPPKHYGKKVVPVGDGPSFPANTQATGRSQWHVPQRDHRLPTTVAHLPRQQVRTRARDFFAGASNMLTWQGYRGYGDAGTDGGAIAQAPAIGDHPRPSAVCQTRSDLQNLTVQWMGALLAQQGLPGAAAPHVPNPESAGAYVGRVWGLTRGQMSEIVIAADAAKHPGGREAYLADQALATVAANLRRLRDPAPATADLLDAERAALAACAGARAEAAEAYRVEQVPIVAVSRLTREVRELGDMQDEALATIDRLLTLIPHYAAQAEAMGERITNRQAFLADVDQGAQVVANALSAAGTVTAGITEVLAIAVTIGNIAYQIDQNAKLASGSSAKTLAELGSAFGQIEDGLLAAEAIYDAAGRQAQNRQAVLDQIGAAAPALVIHAEAQVDAEGTRSWVGPALAIGGAAAAVLLLGALL